MRTVLDEIKKPRKEHRRPKLLGPIIAALIPGAVIALFQVLQHQKVWMNFVIRNITTPIKQGVSWLCDPLPFAVGELCVVAAAVIALIFFVRTVVVLIARPHRLRWLGRRVLILAAALLWIYLGFTVFWGVNYYGDSFSEQSGIEAGPVSVEELYSLTVTFAQECGQLAPLVARDEAGVFCEDVDGLFLQGQGIYEEAAVPLFPFLDAPERTPKQLYLSRVMSYMGFTGVFFPFTGEAMLNSDISPALIPANILHEKAHQRNVAPEQEANFVAIVTGLNCDVPAYQYSSALMGYIHLNNALYSVAPELAAEIRSMLDPRVLADLQHNSAYWDRFESPVEEVSTTVYENFLYSYDQDLGMRSYGACVDLLVAYYDPLG